jgi:hypothetical protein
MNVHANIDSSSDTIHRTHLLGTPTHNDSNFKTDFDNTVTAINNLQIVL